MAFLSPLFLLGALAAAVPLVLHLLRREPDTRLKFAAVRMLEHAPVEHADKRRLRDLLLLALRIAALLLLAFAFARPFFTTGSASAASGVTVVALDTSLSLSAPGRFAAAQALARTAVQQAPAGHRVAVVTFADGAQVAQPPTSDRALAAGAIDNARAGFGATRYRAALSTAADAIGDHDGRVVVVTDLQASGWDRGERVDVPARVAVSVEDVGPLPANLAVTGARVSSDRIIATIRNGGSEPRDVRVRLMIDGAPAGEATASVGPDQSSDVALPPAKGNAAEIAVDDAEGVAADNVRYLVMNDSARPRILVVTNAGDLERDAFYAEQALKASGADGASFDVVGASAAELSGWDAAKLSPHAAIVLLSTRGLDQRGRELVTAYLKNGGGLLAASNTDVDGQVLAGLLGGGLEITALPAPRSGEAPRSLAPADLRHPVFRAFAVDAATLGLVKFRQVVALRTATCAPLARFSSGDAALIECPVGDGRSLVFGSDLDGRGNDFPLHATFLPFLHEAVSYIGGNRSRVASYVVANAPAGGPAEPGLRQLPGDNGAPGRLIAVNVDGRESDPARLTAEEFQAAVAPLQDEAPRPVVRAEARQQEERQNLWRYAILLMIAVLVTESVVSTRTA